MAQELWLGDCIELMQTRIETASVAVVVTSPPYNLNVRYGSYRDDLSREDYLGWIGRVFGEVRRVLLPAGSFFLNVGGTGSDPWIPMDVANEARRQFVLQNHIIWVKSIAVSGDSFGHFKPVNSDRFLNHNFEHIFHFSVDGQVPLDRLALGVPYTDKTNITRWNRPGDIRCRGNTWFIPYDTIRHRSARGGHPAVFPVELPMWCCRLHGVGANTLVLDPFVGHGTTMIAAYRLGVRAIGIDVDADYIEFARRWLSREQATLFPPEVPTDVRPEQDRSRSVDHPGSGDGGVP